MPKGVPVTDDLKLDICELLEKGVPAKDISTQLHTSKQTVYRVKAEFYEKDKISVGMVIAGDKKHGTLTHENGTTYIGTCLTSNGRMKKRRFIAQNSREAEEKWTQWKNDCTGNRYSLVTNSNTPKEEPVVAKTDSIPVLTLNESNLTIGLTKPIYLLVVNITAGYPNYLGYFMSKEEAEKVAEMANHFVSLVNSFEPYEVVEVNPYYETKLDLHAS